MSDVMADIARNGSVAQFVAINAGNHREVLLLPQIIPFAHGAVARLTTHFSPEVLLVAEKDEIRLLIHARQGDGLPVLLKLREFLYRRAFGLEGLMARHTFGNP